MLKSRQLTTDELVAEFFETITPGVIPRSEFIDWTSIEEKCKNFEEELKFFKTLSDESGENLIEKIRDTLLSVDEPEAILKAGFELVGHTNNTYVSNEDSVDIEQAAKDIKAGSEEIGTQCAKVLVEIGLGNILTPNIKDTFLGVQVGLETHRRKNVGGKLFGLWVNELISSVCAELGGDYKVEEEIVIQEKEGKRSKTVDFAIFHKGQLRVGFEANFYTVPGSKPAEIKRAYTSVKKDLLEKGIELIWITDGAGYFKMRKGLREAFDAEINIYNYEIARRNLKADIVDLLS